MQFNTFKILLIIWLITLNLSAQNNERSKIKDFGKSLLQPEEKLQTYQSENQNPEDLIKIETNLVRVDILVLDLRGKSVLGLTTNDFIISENDIPQEIGTFSLGYSFDVPRSIVLIIDYSGSQLPYIATSIGAAKTLVNKLNPKDRMAIVTDDIKLLTGFTHDKKLLKEKLDSIADNIGKGKLGKSLQYSALTATLNELFDSEDIRPIVIFQTDGDEFSLIKNDFFQTVEKSRATIYSVISGTSFLGFSDEERLKKTKRIHEQQWGVNVSSSFWKSEKQMKVLKEKSDLILSEQKSMQTVAEISGGFVENLESPNDASKIYSRILSGINDRYLIGYYSNNQERDGKRRYVKIKVRNHPEYVILGRKFYYAPQPK